MTAVAVVAAAVGEVLRPLVDVRLIPEGRSATTGLRYAVFDRATKRLRLVSKPFVTVSFFPTLALSRSGRWSLKFSDQLTSPCRNRFQCIH
jgi:hypothetical protein